MEALEANLTKACLKIANLKAILEALATRLLMLNSQFEPEAAAEQRRKLDQIELHLRFLDDAQGFLMIASHMTKDLCREGSQSFELYAFKLIEDAEVIFEAVANKYSPIAAASV